MAKPKPCCTPSSREAVVPRQAHGKTITVPTAERIDHANAGSTEGMVELSGGSFNMGTNLDTDTEARADDGEGPVRQVQLRPFWIDRCSVTNEQFAVFIKETNYITDAQKFGWSFVFRGLLSSKYADRLAKTNAVVGLTWWIAVPRAKWDRPEGDRSNLKGRLDHPVTHVSWNDAMVYALWAGKRLPTDAQWEYAARGGLEQKRYIWGDELEPRGQHRCNIFQGTFPIHNTAADGYTATCPVETYLPNGFGLYNMAGNVWEWIGDWFTSEPAALPDALNNPRGPAPGNVPGNVPAPTNSGTNDRKVQRGGSFLCHHSYCNRYRVAARTANTPDSSSSNAGFRCVRDVYP